MDKPAPVDYAIHSLLVNRWSPRAFSSQSIDRQTLYSLLEAARWSPSSGNMQPWRFIIASKEETQLFDKILSCLLEGNIRWAKDAPVLMLTFARMINDKGDNNPHAFHDVGQSIAHLTFQAASMGLFVHQMAGIRPDKIKETFHITDDYQPVTAVAIGYPGDPNSLPDDLRTREHAERARKPLSELVFGENWGQSSDVLS